MGWVSPLGMPIRLPTHRAVELAVGLVLAGLPLVLEVAGAISDAAWAVGVTFLLGALLATLGAAADREGRSLTGSAHVAADRALVVALLVFAALFAVTGQRTVAALCAGAALVQAALSVSTRYAADPRRPADRTRPTTVTSD
jgi:hypothetical protein